MKLTNEEYDTMTRFQDTITSKWDEEEFDALSSSEMVKWLLELNDATKREFGTRMGKRFQYEQLLKIGNKKEK